MWFQNARAKHRRQLCKQQKDDVASQNALENTNATAAGASVNASQHGDVCSDVITCPSQLSMDCAGSDFADFRSSSAPGGGGPEALRNAHSPTALSDLSSSPSLSDLQHNVTSALTSALPGQHARDANGMTSSCAMASNFSDVFCQVTNSMNPPYTL